MLTSTNTNFNWPYQIPSYIENNYFCDTGNPGPGWSGPAIYPDDPLWDGEGCGNPGQLSSHPRCLHYIDVFCSVRKSQQELDSMNCSVSVGVAVSALG